MQDNSNSTPQHDTLSQEGNLPFFTRFLEGQGKSERSAVTHKYPSDWDEMVTHKYPSDDDEGGDDRFFGTAAEADGETNHSSLLTLKYPSDRDEIDLN